MNTNSVYFGTIVIGESISRKIQLANKGALGTNFKIFTLKEFKKDVKAKIAGTRPIEIFMCSVMKRVGYADGFQWLSTFIK